MTYEDWWTEQVAMAWFSWGEARRILGEIGENEPELVRVFAKLEFEMFLLRDMQTVKELFACFDQFKRKAEVDCRPGIEERQTEILIERVHSKLRRIWFWINVLRLDESVKWSKHGLTFRAELVRRGLMAYDAADWPVPLQKVYGILPQATRTGRRKSSRPLLRK